MAYTDVQSFALYIFLTLINIWEDQGRFTS